MNIVEGKMHKIGLFEFGKPNKPDKPGGHVHVDTAFVN